MELKKNENRDLRKFRTLFRNVGLIITLSLTITAFEWKWEEIVIPEKYFVEEWVDTMIFVPPIQFDLPKPPDPKPPKPESKIDLTKPIVNIIETIETKSITDEYISSEEDLSSLFNNSSTPDEKIDITIYDDFQVEKKAIPSESFEVWYSKVAQYCGSNLKERDKMYKGKVWLSFVVEADGSVDEIEVVQSVHKRIDAIAIRAVKEGGLWSPAKMGARPVRQRIRVPISFK